jgi:enoyl-CoA hydratase
MTPLLVERRGGVLVLTLNRPEVRNAIDLPLSRAIAGALDALDDDDALRVGVLTGAGRGFCAGMDLKRFAATGERPWVGDRGFAGIVRRGSRKPLIAALEGFAVAGGLELALACDLIVAARGTKLGIPEVRRGLVAAGGGLRRLPRNAPLALVGAKQILQRQWSWDEAEFWNRQAEIVDPIATSEDARAFTEKRPPVWRGR